MVQIFSFALIFKQLAKYFIGPALLLESIVIFTAPLIIVSDEIHPFTNRFLPLKIPNFKMRGFGVLGEMLVKRAL